MIYQHRKTLDILPLSFGFLASLDKLEDLATLGLAIV
jgi:hypothetical protein